MAVEAVIITRWVTFGTQVAPECFIVAQPETWSNITGTQGVVGEPVVVFGYWSDALWATLMADANHGTDCVLTQRTAKDQEMRDTMNRTGNRVIWRRDVNGDRVKNERGEYIIDQYIPAETTRYAVSVEKASGQANMTTPQLNQLRQKLASYGVIVPGPLTGVRATLIDVVTNAVRIKGRA